MVRGACACGAVRFQVTQPFVTAGYCHCTRCQHRTGTTSSLSGTIGAEGFELLEGEDALGSFAPPGGFVKSFCARCGGHVFGHDPERTVYVVRLGAVEGDPGVRPRWHQWVSSAPAWDPLPDDGLPRFPGPREHD